MSKPISAKNQILAELLEEEGRQRYRQPVSHHNDTDVASETESGMTTHPVYPEFAMADREPTTWQNFEDQSDVLNAAVAALRDFEKSHHGSTLNRLLGGDPTSAYQIYVQTEQAKDGSERYRHGLPFTDNPWLPVDPVVPNNTSAWIVGEEFNPGTDYKDYQVGDDYRRQLHKLGIPNGYMVLHNGEIIPFDPLP